MDVEHEAIDPEQLLAHAGWVRGLARSLVFDQARVDDVVQETWMAALGRRPRGLRDTRAWLGGILRNVVRQQARSERRRRRREEAAARPECDERGADRVLAAEWLRTLVDAVLELPEPYRSTVLAVDLDGESAASVARSLGIPAATVRSRRARALALLRERLDARSGGRREWSLALLPLALPTSTGTGAMPLARLFGEGLWSASKGVLIVSTKLKLTLGLVAVGAILGSAWLVREPPSESPRTAGVELPATDAGLADAAAVPAPRPSERERLVAPAPSGGEPAVAGTHVLRVVLEGITDEDARMATVTWTGVDARDEWPAGIRDSGPCQGATSEFDLDPFLASVAERHETLRVDELEVTVDHPEHLLATARVLLSRGVELTAGRTVHEVRVRLVPPVFWPEFTLAVRDANTGAHLEDVELACVTSAYMGLPRLPGTGEYFTPLGGGLSSPIVLLGGREADDPEERVAGLALGPAAGRAPRLLELTRQGRVRPERGVLVYARAPGHAWGSIAIDVSEGGERELLLGPAATLDVRLANVQLERYAALETVATLCIYWIRADGGDEFVRFERVDETLASDGLWLGDLVPGGYAVAVELGAGSPTHERPVLAREPFSLAAGETRGLVLTLADPPAPRARATLGGVVSFPAFGGEEQVRLQLSYVPTARFRRPDVELALSDLQPVGGVLPTWSFRVEDLPVGLYRVQLLPFLETLVIELPVGSREDVELVLPELAEVLVETVDGRTGERVPLDEFYYRRTKSIPGQLQNEWARAHTVEPGRFRFWTATGAVTIWPRSQGRLGYGLAWMDLELASGPQSVRFELAPVYAMRFEFREGGVVLPVGDPGMSVMQNIRAVDHEGRVTSDGLQTSMRVEVSAPGLYEISFEGIADRYQPIPPRLVDVRAGEATAVIVELQRR